MTSESSDVRTRIENTLDEATWDILALPAVDGRVVMVLEPLVLVEVGMALVNNSTQKVSHWLSEGLIYKPENDEISRRSKLEGQKYMAVIVDPFVLVQEQSADF
jgi:hypothetical protein